MPYDTCGACKARYHYRGQRKPNGRLVLCALVKDKLDANCTYPEIPAVDNHGELANHNEGKKNISND